MTIGNPIAHSGFRLGAFAAPFVALVLGSSASAQISPVKGGYLFRIKYTPGRVTRYQTTTTAANVGSSSKGLIIKIPITLTVKSVSKGVAYVRLDEGAGLVNGSPYSKPQSMTIPLDALDSSAFGGPKFSSKPVALGGTWTAMRPVQIGGGQPLQLNGVYRFQGVQKKQGHSVAVITFDMHGAANGRGTMWLLTDDGSIFSSDMTLSIPTLERTTSLHISMSRMPESNVVHKPR